MRIELHIQGGARAGERQTFDKPVIAIGRHPTSDLRFDPQADLDVSAKHAEIRESGGRYYVSDHDSTNGTFVNGERVPADAPRELHEGDVIAFGPKGPTATVHLAARQSTHERVAIAVAQETRGLKIAVAVAIVVLGGLGVGGYWLGHREAAASDAKLQSVMAMYEQSSRTLEAKLQGDASASAVVGTLQRERDSLVRLAREAKGSQTTVVQRTLERHESATRALTELDPTTVSRANNGAIALIRAEFAGQTALEATGFAVTPNGRVVTNRHVVDANGAKATRVLVKFADTDQWRRAHVVRVPDDASVDLVMLQLDDAAAVPAVSGVAGTVEAPVGAPIVSIGFPEGSDLPMNGAKASTSLTVGIISKIVPDVVQIDSYASHGSSGSPVFDARGQVIGVIYGGEKGSNGRIVYAVPSTRVAELLR
jgi:S1-C subfamily serine protease